MSVVLEAKNVTYRYGEGTPFEVAAVEDVSFAIERGELVGVIGHTGSGKSTLIQHFNGLLPQVEYLTLSLGRLPYIANSEYSSFTVWTTRVSNPV